ncbi:MULTISPECIES: Gfo/Idh/MocA family oxidoreductase [Mycolicibacter]|uniref:Gfo/Idh/MocA family oxidoreductase n=2 Tax=Mycolicibacter TaxID=1073531 RepID=A0ABU5XMB7_9MYCO|nr:MULTISPECIES: Gfo/Idh/MocA family oxidoreductase [unclassified Mycolicibacter]MEB3023344.1 Gfo/Idh/MocA family oxidoreductase [Mycolicibacter sp. MYC098]MEB3035155.1 Gfo/Idh/MocA family oxidoreductase [Mycolicibacter sp. MYC340]
MSQRHVPRSAIIGAGMVGSVHAHAVHRAGGQLTAIAASSPHNSAAATTRLGAGRAATPEEIVAADDVDVVHICTPNNLHFEQVLAALAAGKHVICEKPLATTVADAQALAAAAREAGTVAAVSFIYRFYPMVREARHRLSGTQVWMLHGGYVQDHQAEAEPTGWRSDPAQSGVSATFADIGSHWCDLAEFVTGQRITEVVAAEACAPRPTVRQDDGAVVAFRTDCGAIGSIVVTQSSPGRKNQLAFSFDTRDIAIQFDGERPDELIIGGLASTTTLLRDGAILAPAAARYSLLPPGHPQGYQDCFNSFVADVYEAISTGTAPEGLPQFPDGVRAATIHAAIAESVANGTWAQVPEATIAGATQ